MEGFANRTPRANERSEMERWGMAISSAILQVAPWLFLNAVIFDKVRSFLFADAFDVGHFVTELDAVKFVAGFEQFRSESRRDELRLVSLFQN